MKRFSHEYPDAFALLYTILVCAILVLVLTPFSYMPQKDLSLLNGVLRLSLAIPTIIAFGMVFETNGFKYAFATKGFLKGLLALTPLIILNLISLIYFFCGTVFDRMLAVPSVFLHALGSGVLEEALFRGLLVGGFCIKWGHSRLGRVLIVLFTSILFGIGHLSAFGGNYGNTISSVVTGMCLASVYLYSRNLLCCMLWHTINNSIVFFINGLTQYFRSDMIIHVNTAYQVVFYLLPIVSILVAIIAKPIKRPMELDIVETASDQSTPSI